MLYGPERPAGAPLTVCLLGGESSGKSTLAAELQLHFQALGWSAVRVPEHLREWCARQGRAPQAHEQAALADEQARQIPCARQRPGVQLVLADTSALVVAAYSELYFKDSSLYPAALEHQRGCDVTLLMGLDLPWVSDGLFRDSPAVREGTDHILRRELESAGIPFQTIYGQGRDRLDAALRAIGHRLGITLAQQAPGRSSRTAAWVCERCSDPDCEHRLFSRLLAARDH